MSRQELSFAGPFQLMTFYDGRFSCETDLPHQFCMYAFLPILNQDQKNEYFQPRAVNYFHGVFPTKPQNKIQTKNPPSNPKHRAFPIEIITISFKRLNWKYYNTWHSMHHKRETFSTENLRGGCSLGERKTWDRIRPEHPSTYEESNPSIAIFSLFYI